MDKMLSVVLPAYNEEQMIKKTSQVVGDLLEKEQIPYELVFVNDGSKDHTWEKILELKEERAHIKGVCFSRNFGKEVAMGAAFDYVRGDAVSIIDADLQDPPELILDMIKYYEEGYDDVYAKRRSREGESWLKKFTSKKFYRVLQSVSRVPIQSDTGDFRLLSRRAIEALKSFPEKQRYTKGMFSLIGFKKKEIEFDRDPRVAGETKWNYLKLIDLAIEGITSFTVAPLSIATILGILCAGGSFVYMIFMLIKTLVSGIDVPGYASLVCIILMLGGIQLVCLGVIGEYIGRIFIEVKNRPLYFIDEYSEENK